MLDADLREASLLVAQSLVEVIRYTLIVLVFVNRILLIDARQPSCCPILGCCHDTSLEELYSVKMDE